MNKSRPQVVVFEPDLAVLDYLRLTLGDRYALNLFSEEKSLLSRLEQDDEPDMLLIALHPGRDSFPLVTQIRTSYPNLPIIVLSCTAELRDLEMVIRSGVRAIVMKPFVGTDVEEAVEEHLVPPDRKGIAGDAPREVPLNETHSFV
ncbi:MAG TPA: response regulator, partial [Edaphobacter sp.]|nr:response regulator [Edaphobacter sp.]